jgi:REP element-mobilizing transposase RayT
MPRGPRLDAPGTLHHVMVRGLDRQVIFHDDTDREDFVQRIARLAEAGHLTIYAWVLMANHAHLLIRTHARALSRCMRSLLTGYAGRFNRRHRRTGHVFQNRYKSIVIDEECYFLELVRYLHLNPIRAGVLDDLRALERFPWAGHSALLGHMRRPWYAVDTVLGRFGRRRPEARRAYRAFVAAGQAQGHRPELQGGGLRRSVGGWEAVGALRRGREAFTTDERVLGSGDFVEALYRQVEQQEAQRRALRRRVPDLSALIARVAKASQILPEALSGGGRSRAITHARDGLAYLWVEVLGASGRELARTLQIQPFSVCRAVQRGRKRREIWWKALEINLQ